MLLYFSALYRQNVYFAEMVGIRIRNFLFTNDAAGLLPCDSLVVLYMGHLPFLISS